MDATIEKRLNGNITSLLRAGWTVGRITDTLSLQSSFGKYAGCHSTEIKRRAIEICERLNEEVRAQNRAIAAQVRSEVAYITNVVLNQGRR